MKTNFIYETILDNIISDSTPAKVVDVSGFRRFSLFGRFEGPPDATFKLEINHAQMLIDQETLKINKSGWVHFAKEYVVYAPKIGIVVYHPPPQLKVKMTVYAGV